MRLDTSITTAGRPSTRVTEVASLKVGRIEATSPSVTVAAREAATGMLSTSSGVSISAGTLTAKRPCGPSSAPAATRLLPLRGGDGELVERHAVAVEQHRLGDDLDDLVAGPLQVRRQHARHLLDGGLGVAGDLPERALRDAAAERDRDHREEAEADLVDARLVGVGRQLRLGVVDLGAHVGERDVGIEARLELEQDVAAALERGRRHLLDVLDLLERGLHRLQQQPLGVLRRDAALRQQDVDVRDVDVRRGLLGDADVGGGAGHEQENERSPASAARG